MAKRKSQTGDGSANEVGEPYCDNPMHGLWVMDWNPLFAHWQCDCGCIDDVTPAPNGRPQLTFAQKKARALAQARKGRGDDLLPGDEELMAAETE